MEPESERYKKVLNILRNSKPVLSSTEDIGSEVLRKISKAHQSEVVLSDIIDFLFGWVYISWVRRSLIAASVFLVMIFVWQQSVILKQINFLSRQVIVLNGENMPASSDRIEKRLMAYKISDRMFTSKSITISEKQLEQLMESVNELQVKYKDLLNLIEEDPELKKMIEKKLNENSHTKIKL
jgi:hypothetical protein